MIETERARDESFDGIDVRVHQYFTELYISGANVTVIITTIVGISVSVIDDISIISDVSVSASHLSVISDAGVIGITVYPSDDRSSVNHTAHNDHDNHESHSTIVIAFFVYSKSEDTLKSVSVSVRPAGRPAVNTITPEKLIRSS